MTLDANYLLIKMITLFLKPRHFFSELAYVAFSESIMFIPSSSEKGVPFFDLNSISQFMLSK